MTYTTPGGEVYTLFSDALRQPHLLIAGATGSGKSVIINDLIYTALHRLPSGDHGAQFILIDPKRVELVQWAEMPHTVRYASEPEEMLSALVEAMNICEQRYCQMQTAGQRKYHGTDLYIIVDEFADLMTTQRRAVMPLVQRLAQIGRAAKVHLVIATQTPIAKVLPTEIKCNFDSRFGLRTRSAQDSRNILDRSGLELLPRYGQAVYMTPEQFQLYNIPLTLDADLDWIANFWTAQRRPHGLKRLFSRLTA